MAFKARKCFLIVSGRFVISRPSSETRKLGDSVWSKVFVYSGLLLESFARKVPLLSFCFICKNCIRPWFWFCSIPVDCRRGTGFFSKLNLEGYGDVYGVFTNNHVLGTVAEAENADATFGYEGSSVGEKVKLRPEIMFRTQKVSFNCLVEIIPRDQMTYNDKKWQPYWWNKTQGRCTIYQVNSKSRATSQRTRQWSLFLTQ